MKGLVTTVRNAKDKRRQEKEHFPYDEWDNVKVDCLCEHER